MEDLVRQLSSVNTANNQLRQQAEQYLGQADLQHGFGLALSQVLVNATMPLEARQMAGVLLKQWVRRHWSGVLDEHFLPPQCSDQEKTEIKATLPTSLADPAPQIRSATAMAISVIAGYDWPENWIGLVENLVGCLGQANVHLTNGAMRCLDMFASGENLTDTHVPKLIQTVFPAILHVFSQKEQFEPMVRMRCVRVLYSLVNWLGLMYEAHKDDCPRVLAAVLPAWFQLFSAELTVPDTPTGFLGIKIAILQVLISLVKHLPDLIKDSMAPLLQPIWQCFVNSVALWQKAAIETTLDPGVTYDIESGGDALGVESYVMLLIEFLACVAERTRFAELIKPGLAELVNHSIGFVQLSEEDVQLFAEDPNEFLASQDPDLFASNPRLNACLLLEMLGERFFMDALAALQTAIQSRAALAEQLRASNYPMWWKMREAMSFAVGSVFRGWAKTFQDRLNFEEIDTKKLPFDLRGYIASFLLPDVQLTSNVFLRAKGLWCAGSVLGSLSEDEEDEEGRKVVALPDAELLNQFLVLSAQSIQQPDAPLPLRVAAATAFATLAPAAPATVLGPFVGGVLPLLVDLLQHLSEDTLHMVFDVIQSLLLLNEEATTAHADRVIMATLAVWQEHKDDPFVSTIAADTFQKLAKIPACLAKLHATVLPVILGILQTSDPNTPGILETAVDVLTDIVNYSTFPQPEMLLTQVFPLFAQHMLTSLDHELLSSGCLCLVAYLRFLRIQVADWNNGAVLQSTLQILARILDPSMSESAALSVGQLVSKLISTVGERLGPAVSQILGATLQRLQASKEFTVIQILLSVFIQLFRFNPAPTIQFLSSMNSGGLSALQYVLSQWCKFHEDFRGRFQIKQSVVTFVQLFGDASLDAVTVPGDLAFHQGEGRRTRSTTRGQNDARNLEPFKVRIFKMLVREHITEIENLKPPVEIPSDEEEEGFEEDDDDEDIYADASEFDFTEDMFDEADEETDPDIKNDPIFGLDVKQYLEAFFAAFAKANAAGFQLLAQQLTPQEQKHLKIHILHIADQ